MSDTVKTDSLQIQVYGIGSVVQLDGALEARITAITIRDNNRILYELVWWNERERQEETVEPWEIVGLVKEEKLQVDVL
jgi:hypothetical protein